MWRAVILLLLFVLPAMAYWHGGGGGGGGGSLVLPAANNVTTNWQKAGLLPLGGIPTRNTVCSTVNASGVTTAGPTDDQANITAAIAACPAGQVVQLGTGTFNFFLSELPFVINKGITLRGTGSAVGTCNAFTGTPCWGTYLRTYDGPLPTWNPTPQCGVTTASTSDCPNTSGFVMMAPNGPFDFGWGNGSGCAAAATSIDPQTQPCGTTLTADAAQGDTTIHVTSTASFSSGMIVLLDEAPVLSSTANPVPGQANIQASSEFLNSSPTPVVNRIANPDAGNCTYSFCTNRVTQQLVKISSIGAGTLTFDSPLTMGLRTAHDARAYWPTKQTSSTANPFVQQVGIENLTLDRCTGGCIDMHFCESCWVSNIEVSGWIGGAVNMEYAFRPFVSSSYLHHGYDLDNNGQEYPIGMSTATSECLIENNIITFGGKGMVGRANNGCVIAYNYVDLTMYMMFSNGIGDYWNDMGLNCSHYAGGHHCLFEGNWGTNCDGDETHGNMTYMTFLRNQCNGMRSNFTDPSNNLAISDCNGTAYTPSASTPNVSSGTYNSGTGVISITATGTLPFSGSGINVTLRSLTGTGANLSALNGTWVTITASGTSMTLQGPTGQGSITLTGGTIIGNLTQGPGPLRAGGPMAFGYWMAYVGNVMGFSGVQSCSGGAFTYLGYSGSTWAGRAIWLSGWTGSEWGTGIDANLKLSGSTPYLFRNGNYDYVNAAVNDYATGYLHTFPNSLYLPSNGASPPSFFSGGASCTYTYPWIDSTSGTPVKSASGPGACTTTSGLPAKARFDAGTPFNQP